jgi:hypothetical protein
MDSAWSVPIKGLPKGLKYGIRMEGFVLRVLSAPWFLQQAFADKLICWNRPFYLIVSRLKNRLWLPHGPYIKSQDCVVGDWVSFPVVSLPSFNRQGIQDPERHSGFSKPQSWVVTSQRVWTWSCSSTHSHFLTCPLCMGQTLSWMEYSCPLAYSNS